MPIIDMANPDAMTMVEEYIKNMQPKAFEVCFTQIDQALQNVLDRIQKIWKQSVDQHSLALSLRRFE